jgi:hypothetical protein
MVEVGYCRDCHWWDCHESEGAWGACRLAESYGEHPLLYPDSKARAAGAENYHATLLTDGDFGCVQFKARADGYRDEDIMTEGLPRPPDVLDLATLRRTIQSIKAGYRVPTRIDVGRAEWCILQQELSPEAVDPSSVRMWGLPIRLVPLEHCWIVRYE